MNPQTEKRILGIAMVCHEANKAFCKAIGDDSQVAWEDAPQWQQESAVKGVVFHLSGPRTPASSHENWMQEKLEQGWKYGPVKDPEKKEHPCMVIFEELPWEQQFKDALFMSIVMALSPMVAEAAQHGELQ